MGNEVERKGAMGTGKATKGLCVRGMRGLFVDGLRDGVSQICPAVLCPEQRPAEAEGDGVLRLLFVQLFMFSVWGSR